MVRCDWWFHYQWFRKMHIAHCEGYGRFIFPTLLFEIIEKFVSGNKFDWIYWTNMLRNIISCKKHEIDIRDLFVLNHVVCVLGFSKTIKGCFVSWISRFVLIILPITRWLFVFIHFAIFFGIFGRNLVCFFGENGVVYCPKVGKSVTDSFETVGIAAYFEIKMV